MKLESTLRDGSGFLYTAPLLDVVLLLLVFFLLSSTFVLKSGIAVEVPSFESTLPSIDSSHVVTILPPGSSPQIYFNEHLISFDQLEDFLSPATPELHHVIIRADQTAAFGTVIAVSDKVRGKGYDFAFATVSSNDE